MSSENGKLNGAGPADAEPGPDEAGAIAPPPYRMLVAGDFGLEADGDRRMLGAGGLAALLAEAPPRVTVEAANALGSTPETLGETFEFADPGSLRPEQLIRKLTHLSRALKAMQAGPEALAEAGRTFSRLARAEAPNELLASQAAAFLGDARLQAVVENWHGMALLEAAAE